MKRLTVIVVFLFAGLVAATAISDELEVDKVVKPVAKEKVTQISSSLRGKDEILRMNLPVILQEKRWERTFGRFLSTDAGFSVEQTNDGGYVVAGVIASYRSDGDIWLIKVDAEGIEEWNKTFGESSDSEWGNSIQQTEDSGYIIIGGIGGIYSEFLGEAWLIKTNEDGEEEWNKTFGGRSTDEGESIQQTNDGGYIITGHTRSYGAGFSDVWLIKTDSNGNEEWNRTFGGSDIDCGDSVVQTTDGGYIITGSHGVDIHGVSGNLWLIKVDANGNEKWNKKFGGRGWDNGCSVRQTTDGGYIIAGWISPSFLRFTPPDVWLIKTDEKGNAMR